MVNDRLRAGFGIVFSTRRTACFGGSISFDTLEGVTIRAGWCRTQTARKKASCCIRLFAALIRICLKEKKALAEAMTAAMMLMMIGVTPLTVSAAANG